MAKAILIMDMPIDCADCICSARILGSSKSGRCLKTGEVFGDWSKRQDWCPIREVPEKQALDLFTCNALNFSEKDIDMATGWNACIDEILGKEGEK